MIETIFHYKSKYVIFPIYNKPKFEQSKRRLSQPNKSQYACNERS